MNEVIEAYENIIRTDFLAYNFHVHNEGCEIGKERWKNSKFHTDLCVRVQKFLDEDTGHPYDILIVECQPQVGKSKTITETLPSFYLGQNPEKHVMEVSYNDTFAKRFGRRNREKVSTYGSIFGTSISKTSKSVQEWELSNGIGGMLSIGIGGRATGSPANLLIIDDPVKNRQDADSETYQMRVWDEWVNTFRTRLAPGAKVIVIMTRWHEEDLAGKMLKNERNCTEIKYPAEAEENDLIGRAPGEALCPEIGRDNDWLRQYKDDFINGKANFTDDSGMVASGQRAWDALFMCRPSSAKGNILKREWWKKYNRRNCIDLKVRFDNAVLSVDPAFKGNEENDFVAMQVWGKLTVPRIFGYEWPAGYYLLDLVKEHLNFPETARVIQSLLFRYPFIGTVLIEDKANGSGIIDVLNTKVMGIVPVVPKADKVTRVNSVTGVVEAGNCYLPEDAEFSKDFIEECAAFPRGRHDDQVDAFSQAIEKMMFRGAIKSELSKRRGTKYPGLGDERRVI